MIPGMNSRQAQQMMRKMGIQQEELDVEEVIFKLADRKIVISNPEVSRINMMGQKTFQVSGESKEMPLEEEKITISDEDIKTIVDQTGKSEEEAKEAIEETNGDLAEAIIRLTE